jgi:4-diphosphocytidyl-2-C-methyl-D-erythritol kinase
VRLTARAPAKLNLCLYVGPRRPDGLHEICSIFQSVDLADELVMEEAPGGADEVVCPGVDGPNLAALALSRFRELVGWEGSPVRVTIEKRIPIASGLGGGSADAAAVLRMAEKASGLRPTHEQLTALGMSLGADVPSQLDPGAYLVKGAGEHVERLPRHWDLAAVLLTLEPGLSTADVYAHADRIGAARDDLPHVCERIRQAVTTASSSPLELRDELVNDLEAAAVELQPQTKRALELLWETDAHAALVSGSGPTAFGLYPGRAEAEAARAALESRWSGGVVAARTAPSDYAAVLAD